MGCVGGWSARGSSWSGCRCRGGGRRGSATGGRLERRRGLLLLEDGVVAQTLAFGLLAVVAGRVCLVTLFSSKAGGVSSDRSTTHERSNLCCGGGGGGGGEGRWVDECCWRSAA